MLPTMMHARTVVLRRALCPAGQGRLNALAALSACALMGFALAFVPSATAQYVSKAARADAAGVRPVQSALASQRVTALPVAAVPSRALDRVIAVRLDGATVAEALQHIARRAGLNIAYLNETVDVGKRVTLVRDSVSVREALRVVFEGTDLQLVLARGGVLVVTRGAAGEAPAVRETGSVALPAGALRVEPLPVQPPAVGAIRGTVRDGATGETIPGANVLVVETGQGTSTNRDGGYAIGNVQPGVYTLRATFVGFADAVQTGVEVRSGDTTVVDFAFAEADLNLDEVVVVGYGEQKRSNLTGAIASVKAEDLENKQQLRLDQALQGLASGVTVTQNGGAPGAAPTVHIRGVGSISNTEPLWVVDGVKMDDIGHLSPSDIESVEILKDAAASAIYGARAAHGVILVTTKRGRGDLSVRFSSSVGQRSPISLPRLLGSADFVKYKKESRLNAGQNPEPAWDSWTADTDWIDAYYAGSGVVTTNNLAIARGDDRFNFYLSLGYDGETGILIDNTFKRLSGRINADVKVAPWLKVGESLMLTRIDENPIDNFNENTTGGIPYRSIPIMPVRDETNPYGGWGRAPVYFQGPNPVASHYQQHDRRRRNRIDGSLYAEASPLKGLKLRGTVGYNTLSYLGKRFQEAFNYGAFANTINALTYTDADHETLTGTATATYTAAIGKHALGVMGGYEASRYDREQFNVTGTDFPLDVAWSMNLATGAVSTTERSNVYQSRLLSQFGRFNYNYDERYLFEANVRRDASAPKFGPAHIWGVFPSFSAGWNVSNEAFFGQVPFLTTMRLRGSTGKLGSDNIGDYLYLRTYTSQFSTYAFDADGQNKEAGFYISRFPNEEVKWEEVNMHNVGLDLAALGDRLTFSVDAYVKDTKDLLYGVPIPASVGIATHNFSPVNPQLNIGTLRNTGVDLRLGFKTLYKKLFIDVTGNTSFLRNRMQSLQEGGYIIGGDGGGQIGGMARTQAGLPISSFYGFVVRQMLNTPEDVYAINTWAADGYYQEAGTGPGDFMYLDISGPDGVPDGQITAEYDRVMLGNPWPRMTYGLTLNLVFNETVDVSLQLQGVQGVDIFNASKAYTRNFFGDSNTTPLIGEAWTPEHHTQNPRNIASDPNGNFSKPSSYFVEDGSYLKLRNVQVGVVVPPRYLGRWGVDKLRVYFNANNVLTLTRYSGLDPEIAGSNTSRGIDYGVYPQVRTLTGGVEVQF